MFFFFEKQLILDLLLDKIRNKTKNYNFEELEVHSIYCMEFNNTENDFTKYNGKNILLTQKSKTGEIYDFGIIINGNI